MKKILVIDVPEDCNTDEWCVDGNLMYKNENGYWIIDHEIVEVELMPLPMKRKSIAKWFNDRDNRNKLICTSEYTEYDKGWNDCVEFLEGSEND